MNTCAQAFATPVAAGFNSNSAQLAAVNYPSTNRATVPRPVNNAPATQSQYAKIASNQMRTPLNAMMLAAKK